MSSADANFLDCLSVCAPANKVEQAFATIHMVYHDDRDGTHRAAVLRTYSRHEVQKQAEVVPMQVEVEVIQAVES